MLAASVRAARSVVGRRYHSIFVEDFKRTKVYEIRQYQLHPDKMSKYLALTGGPEFHPRLEASTLSGFFVTETGATLNSVLHIWEYDSLDHRTEVRTALAKNKPFQKYFTKIKPWLVSQSSAMAVGALRPFTEDEATANHFYQVQMITGPVPLANGDAIFDADSPTQLEEATVQANRGATTVRGAFSFVTGPVGTKLLLSAAPTYQSLLNSTFAAGHSSALFAPAPFSPMK